MRISRETRSQLSPEFNDQLLLAAFLACSIECSAYKLGIQSNLAITNSIGPSIFVCYNREGLFRKVIIWDQKFSNILFVIKREFAIYVLVINESDCTLH